MSKTYEVSATVRLSAQSAAEAQDMASAYIRHYPGKVTGVGGATGTVTVLIVEGRHVIEAGDRA